ncbi:unnamed protein product [Medioppia subpectinata]|uniref:Calcium channel flower n=1 Tax=Medioppia subpectinata TaxID=1979941 RepID=A0A7R9L0T8_9ACAR|nr:unnamed protein product [Medioppia subpectinata]CAG2113071.1 unnamed protein product [Medioppia subpectinata]
MNFLRSNPTPAPEPTPASDVPWLMSTAAKVVATIAGLFGIAAGFMGVFFNILSPTCIFAAALLMVEGVTMAILEAPCFCTFLDFAYTPSAYLDRKPHWIKATLYLLFAIIPVSFCIGFSTLLACSLILVSCGLYLVMALGRKASADQMRVSATLSEKPTAVLVHNEELPKGTEPPPAYSPQQPNTISSSQTMHY